MAVPNIFGTATSAIPLSQLDTNFATPVTIGNTAVQLGNTVTSFGNVTLTNVTISSGNVTITGANVSGTANVSTLIVTGNQTSLGNVAITGNISANIATFSAGSNTAPSITTTGDTNTGIFFPAADTIAFSEGGVESMRIDSSGNVGIGTTPSAWGSTAKAVQLPNGCAIANLGAGDVAVTQNAYFDNPNFKYASTTGVGSSAYRQIDGTHRWSYAASGTAGNNITFTEAMRIDTSGNVGIGTSSPSAPLHVRKDQTAATYIMADNQGTVNAATSSGFACAEGGSVTAFFRTLRDATGTAQLFNTSASPLTFGTNNTERARITSGGDLLVGTTSNGGSDKAIFAYADASNNGIGIRETSDTSNTTFLAFRASSSALCGRVTRVGATNAVAYNTSSDYRLKESVQPMTGALTKIALLKPCTYKWKADGSDGQGFIAHELQAVVPDAVSGEKDGEEMQGVDYGKITPLLTAALQEAIAKIEMLEARIAVLEAK